ncbi:MAG: isochorismatase family cysteine hydrolase [Pseudomonadota bacterium]
MHTAVLVVDMVKDSLELAHDERVAARGRAILEPVNRLTAGARGRGWPVIFTTDSFLPGDFLFGGRMPPHSIRGTGGAEVSGLLTREPGDHWLPKRRMSAFFKTDLDQSLRLWGVRRVAVAGLMTPYCVLTSALDAIANDFQAVIVDDASNAHNDQAHAACLDLYRKSVLRPLLSVQTVDELLA